MVASIGFDSLAATILNGASLSGAVDIGLSSLVAISMPAAWTAASLTFQGSADGGATFQNLVDATGAEVVVIAAASVYVQLSPATLIGVHLLKVRSGTSGAAVAQAADRTLNLVVRPLA